MLKNGGLADYGLELFEERGPNGGQDKSSSIWPGKNK